MRGVQRRTWDGGRRVGGRWMEQRAAAAAADNWLVRTRCRRASEFISRVLA